MKRISAIILVLVLAAFAVGCDKESSAGAVTTTTTTTAPMTTAVNESAETTTATVIESAETTTTTAADTTTAETTTTTTAATRRSTMTEKPKSTTKTVTTKATTTAATTVTTTVRTTVTTTTTAADATQVGEHMTALINQERAAEGLAPLTYRGDLQALADTRAAEIKQVFSHTRPNGTSCFTVFDDAGLQFAMLGENIAYGQRSVEEVMEDWMNSEGHRANILNPNFNGVVVGLDDHNWVQLFVRE